MHTQKKKKKKRRFIKQKEGYKTTASVAHTIRKDAEAHTDYIFFSLDPVHEDELPFTLSIEVLIRPKSTS